jgi:hypothetical protein
MANEEKKKFKDTVVGKLFQPKKKEEAPAADKSFGETFKAERKKQGPDGIFTWKGKKYTTKWKEEMAKKPDNSPSKTESAKPPTNSNAPTKPAPKAKDDGPSVGTQLGTAAAIVGTGLAGKAAYSRFKGRGSRLSLPKPPLGLPAPNVAANSPPKPKGGANSKPITIPVTTENASPKVKDAPKSKPVNPRSAKPKTLKPSAQAPNVMSQAPKALAAAPKDKAPVRPNSSPSKPYEWRSNRTLKLTPEMRVSPTVKLDPSTTKTAAEPKPKPKAKIKPRAVRSKPVITRTSTPKVVNVKIKPRVTRPAPKVVADRVAASKTKTVKPKGGGFRMPRAGGVGMTVNDLSGQFMGGGGSPMLPDALEDRMVMNRGGMVKKMSSGGSIARGGGAAKRGTKFKGSF